MAVLAVSAFATVNVETETPSVYHDGSCERVGSMRFIVTNINDYQSATTLSPVYIQILLTDGAKLCHDLDGTDDGVNNWLALEVDGNATSGWTYGEVKARGAAGSNYIEVRIEAGPGDGVTYPNSTDQAWFRLGSTVGIDGNPITLNVYDAADPFNLLGTKDNGSPVCVNYTGRVNGVDTFTENDFNVISLTTYQGALGGTQLGISYSPANPAIAYGGPASPHNFIVNSDCGKFGSDLNTPDVLLCKCVVTTPGQNQEADTYDCYDLYRVGTLDLDSANCNVWLEEDAEGMLPANSILTMTIVDAAGNALSTVDNGVYFAGAPTLTPMVLSDGTTPAELALSGPTTGTVHDAIGSDEYSVYNNTSLYIPSDGVCDLTGTDTCYDNYNLVESYSWSVTTASSTEAARIQLSDVLMGRLTSDGPITAYVKVSWSPYPCGAGGSVILTDYPLNFVVCPPEAEVEPTYYPSYEYFTYFPNFDDGYWWTGLAVTNATYYTDNYVGFGTDQDVDITLYLIEADGDIYTVNAGTLPKSGILVSLMSGSSFSPTLMSGTDSQFGDEPFWVVVKGMPTIPDSWVLLDGFGMIGNGNEGQGTLPRIWGEFFKMP